MTTACAATTAQHLEHLKHPVAPRRADAAGGDAPPPAAFGHVGELDRIASSSPVAGLRILIVVGPMVLGGAERQALLLARLLRDEWGAHVDIWGTSGDGGQLVAHCEEHGIDWRIVHGPVLGAQAPLRYRLRQFKRYAGLISALRHERYDVLLPFMSMPSTFVSLVWNVSRAGICIWNQRSDGTDILGQRLTSLARRGAAHASACIANSIVGHDFLKGHLGVPEDRLHIVHNGVRLAPAARTRGEWRAELGAGDDKPVATMVANLHLPKDHATLLRAWRLVTDHLASQNRRAVLALAGRFVTTHTVLMELAASLGIADSVRFLGAVDDVGGLLHASDLAVFSSFSEGTPNGVLESMAAGLAVVATDLPGVRDAIGPGAESTLVPAGDAGRLAERIVSLLDDDEERRAIGERNRARIASEYSEGLMAERFVEIIDRCRARRR